MSTRRPVSWSKSRDQGTTVTVRNGDVEKAIKLFKRKIRKSGLIEEMRKKRYYVKPSEQRRIAKRRAIKKHLKAEKIRQQMM